MKNAILRNVVFGALVACVMSVGAARAANVTVDPGQAWLGFMNVSELPSNGGAYVFGSGWGTADLCATFSGSNLTLTPNTIGDPDPFWYIGGGGPGHAGNKIMEANMYVEPAGSYPGQTVSFLGMVITNNLAASHVVKAFIRDFAPDYSSSVDQFITLPTSGSFSLTLNTINDPARHVQYGFQMKGPDVWVTDVAQFGKVVVAPSQAVPAKATSWGRMKALYR